MESNAIFKLYDKKLIIYGLGAIGKILLPYLHQDANIRLLGVSTSDTHTRGMWEYDDIKLPIYSIQEWRNLESNATILIATAEKYHGEISDTCRKAGFIDVVPIWRDLLDDAKLYQNIQYRNMPPEKYADALKEWYQAATGEELDLDHPRTYNEKIQWLKLYDSTPLKTRLADKYLVRDWVKEKIGEEYLIPLLGVWDSFDEIDFDKLPDQFVLKANHGSGWNIIVKDKASFDRADAKMKMDRWMRMDFAFCNGFELHYLNIPPKIIAEKYLMQMDGNLLDYKIHCFGGKAKLIQVIGERDLGNHYAKEAFFDINWHRNALMYNTYEQYESAPERPDRLHDLILLAEKLSEEFIYARVDLYIAIEKIKFGELTFSPASGVGKWNNKRGNFEVGSWIDLS